MGKYKRISKTLCLVGLLLILTGVSYSFFNYTKTGTANNIRTGRLVFSSTQEGVISLTNVSPINRNEIDDLLEDGNNVTINITGETTYDEGIEYLVTAEDVHITVNGKKIPVSLYVSGTSDLGTEDEDYFDNRGGDTSNYKVLSGGVIVPGQYLLAGYVAPRQNNIDGSLTIKAFIDEDLIIVSDTYDGTVTDNMVANKTIFTTSEWNSIKGANALSFKIRVEANEGIWVDPYTTPNVMNSLIFNRDGANVKEIRFIQETPLRMQRRYDASPGSTSNGTKMDLTYNNIGKVLAWIEPLEANPTGTNNELLNIKPSFLINDESNNKIQKVDNEQSYVLYVASSGKTQLMTGNGLLAGFSNVEKIVFENVDSSNVETMGGMFYNLAHLTSVNVNVLDTRNVTNISSMFYGCSSLTNIDLSNMGGNNLTNASYVFSGCTNLETINMKNFNFGAITSLYQNSNGLFQGLTSLTNVNLSGATMDNVVVMSRLFYGDTSLISVDLSGLGSDNLQYISNMFYNCNALTSINMSNFNFGMVNFYESYNNYSNYYYAFAYLPNVVTINLTNANTSGVTNMFDMFYYCKKLTTIIGLDTLDFSNVTNMQYMFSECDALTSINLSNLNLTSVITMGSMFYNSDNLVSVTFGGSSPSLQNMNSIFSGCNKLTNVDLTGLGSDNLNDVGRMFSGCTSLKNINMSNFNFGRITSFYSYSSSPGIFYPVVDVLETINLSGANFSGPNITTVSFYTMFEYFSKLKSVDLSNANTSKVTNMQDMFGGDHLLEYVNLDGIDTSNVTDMSYMFNDCDGIKKLDLKHLNTSKVTNMSYMFRLMDNLEEIDISGWGNNNLSNVSHMFANSKKIKMIIMNNFNFGVTGYADLFNFDTSDNPALETVYLNNAIFGKVTNYMFSGCSNLKNVYLNNADTSRVTEMQAMFRNCTSLVSLDLSSFSTTNVTKMSSMFSGDTNLKTIYVSNNWSTTGVTDSISMFYGCSSLVGGQGTTYNSSYIDKTYAIIDGGSSNSGYLTLKTS